MVALSARTGGSRHTGLAALPHENNHSIRTAVAFCASTEFAFI